MNKILGLDNAWPLHDVLRHLIESTNHLLHDHNCDHTGHELTKEVRDQAKKYLDMIENYNFRKELNDKINKTLDFLEEATGTTGFCNISINMLKPVNEDQDDFYIHEITLNATTLNNNKLYLEERTTYTIDNEEQPFPSIISGD